MQPESVEIKISLSGTSVVVDAIGEFGLEDGRAWTIVFCEDVTRAAAATALLDIGVVLRARAKSGTGGDSTSKLRPCRRSQLDPISASGLDLNVRAERWQVTGGS